ncbi:Lrp/AsnC family transcriptional regulator [Candidatus Woesearchaeota archaeon]|nr:Lrp/AsnC family transcriptional regulator [Candidatus Woesearchaeota archaeon]
MIKSDYNLIYLCSENARISLKELSRYLKKSPQRLRYSISSLKRDNFIGAPFCIFDYSYFGLILFRVYFKAGYISEQDKTKIINELYNNPYIVSIYDLIGEYDIVIEFACPNSSRFNKELKKITTLTPVLNEYKVVLNIVTHMYPRNYLQNNINQYNIKSERIIGGDRDIEKFNVKEMAVMKNLLINPTMRFVDLANESGLNIKTTRSIFNILTKRNIIKGFKHIVNTNKLEINKSRLFLKLHNISIIREDELMDHLLKTKEVVQSNKTVGDWDMEVDIEALDKNEIRNIIMQMREEFKDVIERYNIIEFYNYYKRSYLPLYLFKEES